MSGGAISFALTCCPMGGVGGNGCGLMQKRPAGPGAREARRHDDAEGAGRSRGRVNADQRWQRRYGVARASSTGIDVLSGGQLFVTVSGTAEDTTIERGGLVQVLGGLTKGDTIFGGEEDVQFGTAHVSSGGTTVTIAGDGKATTLTITSRGLAVLNSGGFAQNAAHRQQWRA